MNDEELATARKQAASLMGKKGGRTKGPTKARARASVSFAGAVRWTLEREMMKEVDIWEEKTGWAWSIRKKPEIHLGYPTKAAAWAGAKSEMTGREIRPVGRPKVVAKKEGEA